MKGRKNLKKKYSILYQLVLYAGANAYAYFHNYVKVNTTSMEGKVTVTLLYEMESF